MISLHIYEAWNKKMKGYTMDIARQLQDEFQLKAWQVTQTIGLIDDGNTIPFIARYRKEMTGSLSDEILRTLNDRLTYLRNLEARKEQVQHVIEEQGKLTKDLMTALNQATTLVEVEDIYRPFKQKKRTRATIAKEKGLEPLALLIYSQSTSDTIETMAEPYVQEEQEIATVEEALDGAKDILAEMLADDADYRKYLRDYTFKTGLIETKARTKESTVFDMYADYSEGVQKIPGHRILAINRGEKEKILSVKITVEEEPCIHYLERHWIRDKNHYTAKILSEVVLDAYKRLMAPSIERDIRNTLTEEAQEGAIQVFGKNLEQLLLQPPIIGQRILALDPAYRTGCKVAVIDENGKVLDTGVVYPTPPVKKIEEANRKLAQWIQKYDVSLIAIGNGTASRETEQFAVDLIKSLDQKLQYIIVNEAGASVYSASKLGTEEFPEYDVALRSAVSIGRRLQDPLAELVKIDPKSIGVGQYQHDMNQKRLSETLTGVVEKSVNSVGVDLNMASVSLLQYVAGISKTVAKNIVEYRDNEGIFHNRKQLLKVPKLGPKAFEQCAGFLRIRGGDDILDNTGVHPETYKATKSLLKELGLGKTFDPTQFRLAVKQVNNLDELAKRMDIGRPTLMDIIKELEKPGRDPREEMPKPVLRQDILEMKDLQPGMILKGTVRNVIDFGAFVDIGVHQDGLVHISQLSDRYIKHPLEVVSIGDVVDVEIISVDIPKKRIALTMMIGQEKG